jgi:hypothetical protein
MTSEFKQQIENLLEKGEITPKEREILLRKAEKLGLDVDDFELELEHLITKTLISTQRIDRYNISNEELLIRTSKWIQLVLQKTYIGEVEPFPEINQEINLKNSALKVGEFLVNIFDKGNPLLSGIVFLKSLGKKPELKHQEIVLIAEKYLLLLEFRKNESAYMNEKYAAFKETLKINLENYESQSKINVFTKFLGK